MWWRGEQVRQISTQPTPDPLLLQKVSGDVICLADPAGVGPPRRRSELCAAPGALGHTRIGDNSQVC